MADDEAKADDEDAQDRAAKTDAPAVPVRADATTVEDGGKHDLIEGEGEPAAEQAPATSASGRKRRWPSLWWILPIAMIVEFWIYGRNGYIDVCVGKEGHTDFTLTGQARTDENRWKFPRCESRTNLGLRSQYDEHVAEATKVACRGATLFRFQGEAQACESAQKGWQHQVTTRFCPPWNPDYYEHLFWFLK